jgi:hypothetical protein
MKLDSFFDERVSELIPNVEDTRFDGTYAKPTQLGDFAQFIISLKKKINE